MDISKERDTRKKIKLTSKEKADIRNAYHTFLESKDASGIKKALEYLGYQYQYQPSDFPNINLDSLEYSYFSDFVKMKMLEDQEKIDPKELFKFYSQDSDAIDFEKLQQVVESLQLSLTDSEMKDMIYVAIGDAGELIDRNSFEAFLLKLNERNK